MAVKAFIFVLLVAAAPLRGQAGPVQPPPQPAMGDSVSAFAALRPTVRFGVDDARAHHIRVGALTGAVIGAALGIFAGAKLPVGCEVGNCHKPNARLTAIVGLGSMGAVAGGVLGALIGAVLPTATPPRPAGSNRLNDQGPR